jgi:O-antigen/teichoic acid export membrane protein
MTQADNTTLYRKIAGNTLYLFLAQGLGGVGLFLSYVVASHLLTKGHDTSAYDTYILATSVGVFFLSVSELGLTEGTTRLVASLLGRGLRQQVPAVALRGLAILLVAGTAAALVTFAGADPIARIIGSPASAPFIALSALWIVPMALVRVPTSLFEGCQQMKYSFLAAVVREPLKVVVLLALIPLGFTVRLAVWGWVVWSVVMVLLTLGLMVMFLRKQGLGLRVSGRWEGRGLLASSRYLYLPHLSACLLPVLLRLLVNRFSPTGGVGAFHNALSLATLTMMVFLPISQALLPAFAHAHARKQSLEALAHASTRIVGLVAFLGLTFYSFFSGRLLAIFYGAAYQEAGLFLAMAVVGVFFDSFKVITNPLLKGAMQARAVTWIEVVRLVVTLATGVPLTMRFGPLGMMEGFVLGCLVTTVLQFFYAQQLLGIHCWADTILPAVWAAVLCGGWMAGHYFPDLGPQVTVPAALGIVAVLMIVRPPVTLAELQTIWRIVVSRQSAAAARPRGNGY